MLNVLNFVREIPALDLGSVERFSPKWFLIVQYSPSTFKKVFLIYLGVIKIKRILINFSEFSDWKQNH